MSEETVQGTRIARGTALVTVDRLYSARNSRDHRSSAALSRLRLRSRFAFDPCGHRLYLPNDEIVILVSSLHRLTELGIPFVFTNQHAYPKFAGYFTDLSDLGEVPWEQLNARDFKHDPDDPGKKERYQAEALIWHHVPTEALLGICCHSDTVNQTIQSEIKKRKLTLSTQVQRGWYFS